MSTAGPLTTSVPARGRGTLEGFIFEKSRSEPPEHSWGGLVGIPASAAGQAQLPWPNPPCVPPVPPVCPPAASAPSPPDPPAPLAGLTSAASATSPPLPPTPPAPSAGRTSSVSSAAASGVSGTASPPPPSIPASRGAHAPRPRVPSATQRSWCRPCPRALWQHSATLFSRRRRAPCCSSSEPAPELQAETKPTRTPLNTKAMFLVMRYLPQRLSVRVECISRANQD